MRLSNMDMHVYKIEMLAMEEHGPEALFAGALARVAWLAPVTAIYLPTYDFIKNTIQQQQQKQAKSQEINPSQQ